MKDAVEARQGKARKGIIVNGQNINNLRFADDAVILACSSRSLQKIVDSLQLICKDWLKDFFHDHSHSTLFKDQWSSFLNIMASIVQGSVIRPAAYVVTAGDLADTTAGNLLCK